jgi:5'-3' exoribonuclease 2
MGIPYFFYNIYKKYNVEKDLMVSSNQMTNFNIDHLFFDYNSMIHPCAQQEIELFNSEINVEGELNMVGDSEIDLESRLESNIIKNCLMYTRYIINIIKPKTVHIVIDGVAPRAKINQQRERRYKSHFFKEIQVNKNKINWNSNKITPGTMFMEKLKKSIEEFIVSYDACEILLSDADIPGEGEHKMMKYISDNCGKDDKICIYGLDADLIMLSLMNKNNNIILIRDNTFNTKLNDSQRVFTYLNISKLKVYVCKELKSYIDISIPDAILINDYIFICFLLGNDFLEHIPTLIIKENGLNVIIKAYSNLLNTKKYKSLVTLNELENENVDWSKCINLDMLRDLLEIIAKSEDYFFKNIYSVYKDNKKIYKDVFDLNYINENEESNVYFYTEDYIKFNVSGYQERYYKFYGIDNINNACNDYLKGLIWTLGYYSGHKHNNWTWYYKYKAVPFATDLFRYLSFKGKTFEKTLEIRSDNPNSNIEQLFMVLPRDSLIEITSELNKELMEKIIRIFKTNSIEIEKYYPQKIYLEFIHKEFLWQSKVFLNNFNKEILKIFI